MMIVIDKTYRVPTVPQVDIDLIVAEEKISGFSPISNWVVSFANNKFKGANQTARSLRRICTDCIYTRISVINKTI